MGYGVAGLVMSTGVVNTLTVIFCQWFLHKFIADYQIKIVGAFKTIRKIFGYSVYTFISQIAQLLNSRLAEILIGILVGPSAVTYFNVPARLIGLFASGTSSFTTVLFPFASELQSEGDISRTQRTFLQATRYFSFLIVPFYFIFIIFSKPILELWLSTEIAEASYMIMSIYALAYLISGMTIVPSQYLQGFGRVKFISMFSVGIILVSVLAYFPLIKLFGLIGAGYVVLFSQVIGVFFIYYALKVIGVSVKEYLHSNFTAFLFGLIGLVPVILLQTVFGGYLREMYLGLILMALFFIIFGILCFFYSEIGRMIKGIVNSNLHWRLK
jgi:O-antigen/teichoic acid export membrane protein